MRMYDYATFRSPWSLEELVERLVRYHEDERQSIKRQPLINYNSNVRLFQYQWKFVSGYNNNVVERLAAKKSVEMTRGVFEVPDFQSVVAREPVHIEELRYTDRSVEVMHAISHEGMHANPVVLFRSLSEFYEAPVW